jgi:molecular chaperone GrpE
MSDKNHEEEFDPGEKPLDELSGEELLNKISEDSDDGQNNSKTENDVFSRLGFSKKDKQKKENEELKHQLADLNDKYLRLFADFDNFRKRNQKERLDLIKTAGAEVIIAMLPVLDDFQRALKQMEATQDPMTEGVKLIFQKLLSILESKGLKPMNSAGETFNPELHEAITEVPASEENKGKVVDEIERGYYLNDKIIRHAKVVVGK